MELIDKRMYRMNRFKIPQKGFTLIELMIAVAIVAILAAIAFPNYSSYVVRAKRTAAQSQMMDIASREQQFLLADRSYADQTKLESSGYSLPTDVSANYGYNIAVGNIAVGNAATPPTFVITFTPTGGQSSDGTISLSSEGVKTPASKW